MKTYNKTFLPDVITYNGKEYKRDSEATEKHRTGTLTTKGHVLVNVIAKNLKRRLDFHGNKYKPTAWIFTHTPASTLIDVTNMSETDFRELHHKNFTNSPSYKKAYNKAMKQIKTFGY